MECHNLAGGEMTKVAFRIMLLLSVLALGRVLIGGFFQPHACDEVTVVLSLGGETASVSSATDDSRED